MGGSSGDRLLYQLPTWAMLVVLRQSCQEGGEIKKIIDFFEGSPKEID
jgi:hypothetical protein